MTPRSLWLPTIIDKEKAKKITLRTYLARTVKEVTDETAKKFVEKAGKGKERLDKYSKINDMGLWISYAKGRNQKLRVVEECGVKYYSFTEWAVCLSNDEPKPSAKKRKRKNKEIKYSPRKDESKIIICVHENSTLYYKKLAI